MHEYLCMLYNKYSSVMDGSDTTVGARSVLGRLYVSRSGSDGPKVKYGFKIFPGLTRCPVYSTGLNPNFLFALGHQYLILVPGYISDVPRTSVNKITFYFILL